MEENKYHVENLVYPHQEEFEVFIPESIMCFFKKRLGPILDPGSRKRPVHVGEWTPVWPPHQEAESLWTRILYFKFKNWVEERLTELLFNVWAPSSCARKRLDPIYVTSHVASTLLPLSGRSLWEWTGAGGEGEGAEGLPLGLVGTAGDENLPGQALAQLT